ncbi:hypothetical protein Patl1_35196 [Pistacia atlantica]|uniref:Uncharacterized protein n=1 Tax=Pistacia atlantica TaxID=434234 RepID=A0ACC0ZWH7_9ROSI|nr:hypothetical protein Patl1_35196 [Pistacia atlantica]
MADDKYNLKNPAVKRILQEVKEMKSNPSDDFISVPLEENIFEWQFAIRGLCDTESEGGIYHGRIQLPAEYPFKPPSFMLLTLDISGLSTIVSLHRILFSSGNASQIVRSALVALIAFMPTNANGAWGPLDYKKEERCVLAIKSREAAQRFGTSERQKLIDEIHEYMLSNALPVPQLRPLECSEEHPGNREGEAEEISQDAGGMPSQEGLPNPAVGERITEEIQKVPADANPSPTVARASQEAPANANPSPSGVRASR